MGWNGIWLGVYILSSSKQGLSSRQKDNPERFPPYPLLYPSIAESQKPPSIRLPPPPPLTVLSWVDLVVVDWEDGRLLWNSGSWRLSVLKVVLLILLNLERPPLSHPLDTSPLEFPPRFFDPTIPASTVRDEHCD